MFTRVMFSSMLCLSLWNVPASSADPRPTRSECIIGFKLDWSHVEHRYEAENSLRHQPPGKPPTDMALSHGGSRLYMQFDRDCSNKEDQASELIAYWRSIGLDLPVMHRIPDPIVPSPDTIDVRGPPWKDPPPVDVVPEAPDQSDI